MEEEKKEEPVKSMFDEAKNTVEALKKENDRREAILKQEQELEARRMIGGKADAGKEPEQPKEESPKEYAKRISSGKA